MNFETFFKNILSDLKVELYNEFTENFRRKAFFDQAWPQTKLPVTRGSLMVRHAGGLKDSLKASIQADGIHFTSSKEYAAIHNEGGEIPVTVGMKKFFWAMYYKSSGAVSKTKGGKASNSQRNKTLTFEAEYWKSLALMKTGSKIRIPKRQFIGDHPQVDATVEAVINDNMKELEKELATQLRPNS